MDEEYDDEYTEEYAGGDFGDDADDDAGGDGEEDIFAVDDEPAQKAPAASSQFAGPVIFSFDVDNPRHTPAQRARERFAYNAAGSFNAANLTDEALLRAQTITQQMRDPALSSRNLMQLRQELGSLDVGYSPQQIQRIQALNNQQGVLDEKLAAGDISQAEYEAGAGRINTMIGAVKPQRIPPKKSPWPPGQGVGDTWRSQAGDVVTRDEKGKVSVLTKYALTPEGLEEKYFNDSYQGALKITKEDAKTGVKQHLSPDEAAEYAAKATDAWRAYRDKQRKQRAEIRGEAQGPVAPWKSLTQGPEEPAQLRDTLKKAMGGRKISEIKDPNEKARLMAMYQKLKQLEQTR